MKKKLYILDSIEAIKILLRYENPKNIEIITLNFSLNNFLKLKKIFSRNIYEYFSNSEIKKCVNKSYSTLNRTLVSLDEDLRRNNFFKKKKITSFFHPIFITQYQKTFFSYFLLKKLLEKKINLKKYKVTIFYDNFLLKNKFPIYESLGSNKLFKDIELRIVNSKNSDLLFQIKTQILNLNHILRFITSRLKTFYLKKSLKIKNIFLKKKFKILLLNYDYNLLFFLSNKNYNISLYEDIKIKGNGDEFLEHSLKIIKNKKKFQNNKILCSIQKYLLENKDSIDLNLTSKVSKQNFKYIFWRYPVSLKTNENLLVNNEKKIKIIGFQHGAHYLTKKNYYHFDQDFNNCNYWISYNSSQADYKKIYGVKKKRCKIIKQSFLHKKKEVSGTKLLKNQILYPLRQINHLYESGIEDKIVMKKQIEILKILEGFKKNYMIKPLFPINRKNCALIDIFKKLKYGKILSGISLKNYLKLFEHKIIVLDNYETTLYDAIEYSNNSKIIIIDDENDFGYKLNKNFKIKVPSRVIFLKKISNLKDILKKKIKTKKKHILKNNFAFNNYNIINKIIN